MNELSERALKWLSTFVASRKNAHAASLELGRAGNWAQRILDNKATCNWNYVQISKMAARLGMSSIELDAAIRENIAPAGLPKEKRPRAKPRRVQKSKNIRASTNRP